MATHSSTLAFQDRGARRVMAHGVAELNSTEGTEHAGAEVIGFVFKVLMF